VVDYDPDWPTRYHAEAQRIRDLLGDQVVEIEHVGSTAVPGLAAKDIIDIDLVVPDSANEDAYLPTPEGAGYLLRVREPNWHEHRYLKGPDTNINLHVFSPGCPEVIRHRLFRDWLRDHDDDRDRYAAVKQELALRHDDVRDYSEAKNGIIDDIYARAFAAEPGTRPAEPASSRRGRSTGVPPERSAANLTQNLHRRLHRRVFAGRGAVPDRDR
jgi:GrpB-like predicted nucleotidyltransferase (UPF0157 family)